MKFSKIQKNCLTPCSVILRRVGLRAVQNNTARSQVFRKYFRKNEFFSETILDRLSGTQMGSIHEKNAKKSRDTATLMRVRIVKRSN